jgi:polar amino acid transport system permease protein
MLKGIPITLQVLVYGTIIAAVMSFVFGLGRVSRFAFVRTTSYIFVELFRGTSLIVQLMWIYFGLPHLGVELPKMAAGAIAIGLNYGAYGSEIVRSSVLAIPKGQTEASIALNFTRYQRMRHIIVPQALLRMLPPFGNLQIELLKGTALVYFIGLADVFYRTMTQLNNYMSLVVPMFIGLLVIYFVLSQIILVFYRWLERKLAAGRV